MGRYTPKDLELLVEDLNSGLSERGISREVAGYARERYYQIIAAHAEGRLRNAI